LGLKLKTEKAVKPARFLTMVLISLVLFFPGITASVSADVSGFIGSQEGQEITTLLVKNQLLNQELELASKPQIYFLLNLGENKIELKARGLVLKEWKIARIRRWGPHPDLKILTLEKKSALFAPKRKKIKPGEMQSSGTFEPEALELKDMPTVYTLRFKEGVKIYVRPGAKKLGGHLASLVSFLRWYGWFPIENLISRFLKKEMKLIEITLSSSEEAKAIYWGLLEGMKGLIFTLPEKPVELN
jgi:hypothetical protein